MDEAVLSWAPLRDAFAALSPSGSRGAVTGLGDSGLKFGRLAAGGVAGGWH